MPDKDITSKSNRTKNMRAIIREERRKGISPSKSCEMHRISRATYYRYVNEAFPGDKDTEKLYYRMESIMNKLGIRYYHAGTGPVGTNKIKTRPYQVSCTLYGTMIFDAVSANDARAQAEAVMDKIAEESVLGTYTISEPKKLKEGK